MKRIRKTPIPGARILSPLEMNRMHFSAPATSVADKPKQP